MYLVEPGIYRVISKRWIGFMDYFQSLKVTNNELMDFPLKITHVLRNQRSTVCEMRPRIRLKSDHF